MKGNIYMYAVFVMIFAMVALLFTQFMDNIVPNDKGRVGNTISISQYSFGFTPNEIELKQGETVTFEIKSAGGDHVFAIDAYQIKVPVANNKVIINFTASIPGTFLFYDPLPGHNESGEQGILTVR